jgi:hypothetical protein
LTHNKLQVDLILETDLLLLLKRYGLLLLQILIFLYILLVFSVSIVRIVAHDDLSLAVGGPWVLICCSWVLGRGFLVLLVLYLDLHFF